MKLYHYSTSPLNEIITKRQQGLSAIDIENSEKKAAKIGLPLPYIDHISFFFDPIPLNTIASIFKNQHPFWKPGQVIYEHVVDTSQFEEKTFFQIVETPVIDKFTDQFDWEVSSLTVRSQYFQAMHKEMQRIGYLGYGVSKMVKKAEEFIGKIEGHYIQARLSPSAEDTKTLYAGGVPHLMIYPKSGRVKPLSITKKTVGSAKPFTTELYYHLSFRDNLPDVLHPRHPDGSGDDVTKFTEKLPPRVSFSPTIQQCFSAIYPNISHYFENENFPYMDMYVYVPTRTSKKLTTEDVRKAVWDSHVTDEVCYVSPVQVTCVAKIRIFNPGKTGRDQLIYTSPFGNPMLGNKFVSPKIKFEILQQFKTVPLL